MFGAAGLTARDAATGTAVRPTAALPPAFVLGGCVEEMYFLMAGWALEPDDVPAIARQARVARDVLLSLGGSAGALARFEAVVSTLAHADLDAAEIRRAATDIEGLMAELRGSLTPDDAQLYDLGAMTSRVHFGVRIAQVAGYELEDVSAEEASASFRS